MPGCVGFVGLGAMGGRMASQLLTAGHDLIVHNRTEAKMAPLVAGEQRLPRTSPNSRRSRPSC